MQGGAHVGVGVKLVEVLEEPGESVIPGKFRRAQVLGVGEQEEDNQRSRVGENDEIHHPAERMHIKQQGVQMHPNQKDEPE